MPRRPRKSPQRSPRALALLALAALLAFVAGEAAVLSRTDSGRLQLARWLGAGGEARVRQLVGRQVRRGLEAVGVGADSIHERVASDGPAALRWRVGLGPGGSTLQANYAITRRLEGSGGAVLAGRERATRDGGLEVTLLVGLPRRPTHEIVLARAARTEAPDPAAPARVALVLYGFGDDLARAERAFALPLPLTAAILPGSKESGSLFRAAAAREREVVLHLPLEPVNYPRVDPGPGAVLVTMRPAQITGLVRRYLDQAGPAVAVANHMGSLATQDPAVMSAVYRELKRRGLPFIHLAPVAGSVCRDLAADRGVAYSQPDAVIDGEARSTDRRALDRRWHEVLDHARGRGRAVVWLRATPGALEWLPGAAAGKLMEGVSLSPLSAVMRRPLPL